MCFRFVFLLITRVAAWLRLSRREETRKTAEILIPGQLWVPKTCATWADVLQYADGSVGRLVSARPTGGGMIFGLWA